MATCMLKHRSGGLQPRRARALGRARQLADEIMPEGDFELVFERLANGFLDVFSADRAVTILFEEDGINPLMWVFGRWSGERYKGDSAGSLRGGRVVRVRGCVSGIVVLILSLNSTGEHSTGARECV